MADLTVSVTEVRAMREEQGLGMYECKRIILKRKIVAAIDGVEDIDHVRDILRALMELVH